jgi:hypothetical protein
MTQDGVDPAAIFILDELVAKPGQGERLRAAYLERYAPGARSRGMVLAQSWRGAAPGADEAARTLVFVWSVPGVWAWWAVRFQATADPAVAAWWDEAEAMIERRSRRLLIDGAADA